MCPREEPLSWLVWLGLIVAGAIFAITMASIIGYVKKRRQRKIRSMRIDENMIDLLPTGGEQLR